MKRTLLAVIAAAALLAGCGTDSTPVAVSGESATMVPSTSVAVEEIEATTTRSSATTTASNWDPDSADPIGDAAQKEAERQVAANPEGSGKLAIEMTKLTGEKLTSADAQLMAGYLCAIIALTEMNNEEGYSNEDVVDETSREMGMSKENAMRLLTLAVEYRCPDASIN
ncbi:hypothetical protein C7T36_18605 [Rhodococcus sp. AD45-ID]|uniref:hypothetical protein n=1 Tax=unclassified Rhodococcus (in: high G+C Gram-positive bacteria) TaxID=192944 RepID=UPI0005D33B66|nr:MULTISPECIES: hypothetical protein [unclassified Rhodococcus (in: high G+C Gram-positive bacteria)]KJF21995.1 hypothetical protein SZ00_02639 [Rhodococcus sp. AD45]PSR39687.1 hypothetical protein C7T36_18605 [Rhodococcus sp. AD45-ID]